MKQIIIGIDNGVTGSIGVLKDGNALSFGPTPTKSTLDYQTTKCKYVTRIDMEKFASFLKGITDNIPKTEIIILLERPLKNPRLFNASVSAMRAFEIQLAVIEHLNLPFQILDSKTWQHRMLPPVKGHLELKKISGIIGKRIFPSFESEITKQKDADGLLIAEWYHRRETKITTDTTEFLNA